MKLLENILNALGAIWSNKLRSSLTMLGVIIGVASVVLMVAIGKGAQKQITSRIESLGSNLLIVTPGSPSQTNVRGGGSQGSLTMDDALAVTEHAWGIKGVSPEARSNMQAIAGSMNMSVSVTGVTPIYETISNFPAEYGSFITQEHLDNADKVAVIGQEVAKTLYPGQDPVGSDIRLQNGIYTVVGVMSAKGQQGFTNYDTVVFIPLSTMHTRVLGTDSVNMMNISVIDQEDMEELTAVINKIILTEHGITDPADADFSVLNQADAVETLNEVTQIFTVFLGGIAAISLFVGGIGVMNIMLVSVTERTREIGIRKAIGAKKKDILIQFLVESTVLSVMGGAIGVVISVAGAVIASKQFNLEAIISVGSVIMALVFSMGVGIFFGSLPAYKAAKLKPIQALRYE